MAFRALLSGLAIAMTVTSAGAATLTITPDKSVYSVGEEVALVVAGDPMGQAGTVIAGTIVFGASIAAPLSASQTPLTALGGALTWVTFPLSNGPGFADAFLQLLESPLPPDGPLQATVVLTALFPGTLSYEWDDQLQFFGVGSAPGGSVLIVPEVSTGLLFSMGIYLLAVLLPRSC